MGVERLRVDQPGCLRLFLQLAFPGKWLPKASELRPWLFQSALLVPGLRHCFDGVLRRGLAAIPWFPEFLERMKGVGVFFPRLQHRGRNVPPHGERWFAGAGFACAWSQVD